MKKHKPKGKRKKVKKDVSEYDRDNHYVKMRETLKMKDTINSSKVDEVPELVIQIDELEP